MKLMVTGGLGFLGSNLVSEALGKGYEVTVLDDFSKSGAEENRHWLSTLGHFELERCDVGVRTSVDAAIKKHKPDAIFHVAGQVAMSSSIRDPRKDFETNALGTFNILDAARRFCPSAAITYSSTNKVYGDLTSFLHVEGETRYAVPDRPFGFDEATPLEFHSPYGCSKGAADQYMLDFHRIYGMKTTVFRHSSIYGGRQFSTYDQGWIGWFVSKALQIGGGKRGEVEIHGNGKQVRDILFASDAVSLYFSALQNPNKVSGQAFNIGGGPENSLSLLELFDFLEREVGAKVMPKKLEWRESDQKVFIADTGKIRRAIGWSPKVSKEVGLAEMIKWCSERK